MYGWVLNEYLTVISEYLTVISALLPFFFNFQLCVFVSNFSQNRKVSHVSCEILDRRLRNQQISLSVQIS